MSFSQKLPSAVVKLRQKRSREAMVKR